MQTAIDFFNQNRVAILTVLVVGVFALTILQYAAMPARKTKAEKDFHDTIDNPGRKL